MNNDNRCTDNDTDWHSAIWSADLVNIRRESPRGRVSIEGLNGSAAPRGVPVSIYKQGSVASHDGYHDSVIDETTKNSAVNLGNEHD
jgi:hypothetical protein